MGNCPALCELHSGYSREPVVAVQDIILSYFASSECFDVVDKFRQILVKLVLVDGGYWPSFYMNNAHICAKLNDARAVFICPTGKDIDGRLAVT